ncbi:MAG: DNA repair protein RecN [Alphaproteobacteria bacterium]|nr:DNA repair protein RecN [Alphaproteobacteria bacterium]
MLQGLSIHDVVLIDRLDLGFETGLSALTGETGAGKSILLDALGLALGARADAGLVAKGAPQATVAASFALDTKHPARALLAERGLAGDDDMLILRRVVSADGRSRAFVNDQPVPVGTLRELGNRLVEVHGQFDTHGLLDVSTHRAALDAFGGLGSDVDDVTARYIGWRDAEAAESEARERAARAAADEGFLRHAAEELERLDPKPGEETELAQRRALLAAREKLIEALSAARSDLAAGKGVEGSLRSAERQLRRVSTQAMGKIDRALAALERAAVETADAVAEVEALESALDLDTGDLESAEERLFALRAVARKHRVEVDRLADLRAEFQARLAALDDGEDGLKRLAAATTKARNTYLDAAKALAAARRNAAQRLDKAIARELPPLKLDKAKFRTRVEELPEAAWAAAGIDRVAFEVATNPGADLGPIDRIASGGELARFMLALKVALRAPAKKQAGVSTLIFDEVDSGIGGAVAAAVGERLAVLAETAQILVVTHSPQVAARAQHHWRVVKKTSGRSVATRVDALDAAARREEIARMLSGMSVTAAARAAAADLLAGAGA